MFRDATRAVTLVGASMRGAEFDVARMAARAGEGGTTLTELADHLAREHGVPFRTAHAIAGRLSASCQANDPASLAAMLRDASRDALGAPVELTEAELTEIMSPRHFVDVRRTPGGPSPIETSRASDVGRRRSRRRSCLAGANTRRDHGRRGTPAREEPEPVTHIQRQYVRVVIVWVGVLAALYIFQELFS